MTSDEADAALAARLAPRVRAVHQGNGGDWEGTLRNALALVRRTHVLEPRGRAGAELGDPETPDAPREDD